jgi:hypothetical protein
MEDERTTLKDICNIQELRKQLNELSDPTQRQRSLLDRVNGTFGSKSAKEAVVDVIK